MAKLTDEDVLKLARLSRLHITKEELSKFKEEISAILGYVEQLQNIDLESKEPTNQVTGLTNVFRDDVVKSYGMSPEELLKNVPATHEGYIKVRRVLE